MSATTTLGRTYQMEDGTWEFTAATGHFSSSRFASQQEAQAALRNFMDRVAARAAGAVA